MSPFLLLLLGPVFGSKIEHGRGVGCFSSVEALFDCDAGIRSWQTGWSIKKKASRGCGCRIVCGERGRED